MLLIRAQEGVEVTHGGGQVGRAGGGEVGGSRGHASIPRCSHHSFWGGPAAHLGVTPMPRHHTPEVGWGWWGVMWLVVEGGGIVAGPKAHPPQLCWTHQVMHRHGGGGPHWEVIVLPRGCGGDGGETHGLGDGCGHGGESSCCCRRRRDGWLLLLLLLCVMKLLLLTNSKVLPPLGVITPHPGTSTTNTHRGVLWEGDANRELLWWCPLHVVVVVVHMLLISPIRTHLVLREWGDRWHGVAPGRNGGATTRDVDVGMKRWGCGLVGQL